MLALDVVDIVRVRMSGASGTAAGRGDALKPPKVLVDSVRTRASAAFTSVDLGRRGRGTPVPAELGVDGSEVELPIGIAFIATDWERACIAGWDSADELLSAVLGRPSEDKDVTETEADRAVPGLRRSGRAGGGEVRSRDSPDAGRESEVDGRRAIEVWMRRRVSADGASSSSLSLQPRPVVNPMPARNNCPSRCRRLRLTVSRGSL